MKLVVIQLISCKARISCNHNKENRVYEIIPRLTEPNYGESGIIHAVFGSTRTNNNAALLACVRQVSDKLGVIAH